MSEQMVVLGSLAMHSLPDGEMCMSFAFLESDTGLPRKRVRFLCRLLKRKGLAEFHSGLFTEDGDMAGAGYCISHAGLALSESAAMEESAEA